MKSIDELKELLEYSYELGVFFNKTTRCNRSIKGAVAGSDDGKGYTCIRIDGVNYRAHRLAWAFHYGEWPCGWLDHINRDRMDNRIENLRIACPALNAQNRIISSKNKTGHTGVRKAEVGWVVSIGYSGRQHYIGTFRTLEEAVQARKAAEKVHHIN